MRLVYPLSWSRLGHDAMREQSVCTAAALARRGVEVALLMPRGRRDPALTADALRAFYEVDGDFRLLQRPTRWTGTDVPRSLMWLRQAFHDPATLGADILYSRIPAMLGAGHLSPIPYATEHYRLWPDELPWVRPLFRRTNNDPNCLGLILHSEHAAGAYRRAGIDAERLLVAHNGADPGRLGEPLTKAAARERLGLPQGRAVAVYAGRIGRDKGLERLAQMAALRPQLLFLLVGANGKAATVRETENFRLVPWQSPHALGAWLRAADMLLVPPSRAPLERHRNCVLPMKLFTYLAAGRPILAPDNPDTAELLIHGETAFLVEPDRPQAAAAALDRMLGDGELAARLASNARRLADSLSWDARAEKVAAFLQRRLAQRSLYSSTVAPARPATTGAAQAPTAAGT